MNENDVRSSGTAPDHDRPEAAEVVIGATPDPRRRSSIAFLATFGGMLACVTLVAVLAFGSLPVALRYARGERLLVEPTRIDVGPIAESEPLFTSARVRNYTGAPVGLLGFNVQCTCVEALGLPATVPAGGVFDLNIKVRVWPGKETVDEQLVIFTDNQNDPHLRIRVRGKSRE